MTSPPRPRETPAWQLALSEALSEALPRLLEEQVDPLLQELIAALTDALCRGEVLLDLDGEPPENVSADQWPRGHRQALAASSLARDPEGPLVLRGSQLAWRRWIARQEAVLAQLLQRAGVSSGGADSDPQASWPGLERLDGQQRRAVLTGLHQRLVLILGGPGTGKTSTVAQLLAAWRQQQPEARVHLAAPTGKAAARLRAASGGLAPCSTLHRLLESRGDGFGRHRQRPLELDLLVIDELSMVDLALMEALLEALPASCSLVLVGDQAQLPPIAPGAVLQTLRQPALAEPLAPVCIELRTTYRNDGAIARVAASLRAAIDQAREMPSAPDPDGAPAAPATGITRPARSALEQIQPLLEQLQPSDNLLWQQASRRQLPAALLQRLVRHQRRLAALAAECWPGEREGWAELLAERDRLLVLSPLRRGRWGIDAIHRALLAGRGDWPVGTPLLCRRNLPALGLANGDVGVLVGRPGERALDAGRILFGQEEPLWLHPAQLAGALEPALALTVHKAQGSEAREVVVLLEDARAVEARLLYTALTRARERALLITAADSG